MKLLTHAVFSSGLVFVVTKNLLSVETPLAILISAISIVMQYTIDALSHEQVGNIIRRTSLFHSLSGATALAIVFTLFIYVVVRNLQLLLPCAIGCLVSSYSHLLLDSITEKGIYVKGRRYVRKRMISSNNALLNTIFTLIGIWIWLIGFKVF
ncbi:MAG: DUF1286 domain-containing protein [Sulfolobales archaeon]